MGITSTVLRSFNTLRIDPYPVEKLKRVDRPTTVVREDQVQRVDERESGFNRATRGDFGAYLYEQRPRSVMVHVPLARRFTGWDNELFGYDKPNLRDKWWFELQDVDGRLDDPKHAGDRGNHTGPGLSAQ